jgi:hypothetical protein
MSRRRRPTPPSTEAEVPVGFPKPLLHALHLLTRDGALNADARRKLKQIEHLLGLIGPAIDDVAARHEAPVFVDFGAGKAYLGLLLASARLEALGRGRVLCVESKVELVDRVRQTATEAGLTRVEALHGTITDAPLPERVHVALALHACDTATDDALLRAVACGADHIAVVPCCQAEVARQLTARHGEGPIASLHRHAWHRREFGSHLTNVVRALWLEAHGYQVTVTELAGWEHSLKNELILGRRVHRENREAQARLDALLEATGVRPRLLAAGDGG